MSGSLVSSPLLQFRGFSSSSVLPDANAAHVGVRTLFVAKEGDPGFAEIVVPAQLSVAGAIKKIAKQLCIPKGTRLSSLTAHVCTTKTDGGKPTVELGGALDSTLSLADARVQDKTKLVIREPGSVPFYTLVSHGPPCLPPAGGDVEDGMQDFLQALPHAAEESLEDGGELITLPKTADGRSVSWPSMDSRMLFARPIFRDFYEKPEYLNSFHLKQGRMNWMVTGDHRGGKSAFGLYCLWRLVKEGRRVCYYYPGASRYELHLGSGPRFEAHIVDGVDPTPLHNVPTLAIRSEGDETTRFSEFQARPFVRHLNMPFPTIAQLQVLGALALYPRP